MTGLLLLLMAALAAGDPEPYGWPLDLPREISSSFGEYRPGRFHAGIDLRTHGTGREVRAPRDGYVSRVRCSPWGYGKALYIRLDDGHSVVFAHLEDFMPTVRDYVRAAQHRARNYTVDLYPPPDRFPVTRGQVVARTGRTGSGPPHLHYEIRDGAERPVNPWLLGISWPDDTLPVLRKVLVMPDGPGSTVNGNPGPAVLTVVETGPGEYGTERVTATGRVGFGIDLIDPANEGNNRLGVRVVRTTAAGGEVFRIQKDRLSYDDLRNAAVAYHPFLKGEGRFLLQWRWPGNVCEVYAQTPRDGWFDVPAAPVDVEIEAIDFAGNAARVIVPLHPGDAGPPEAPLSVSGGPGAWDVECLGTWLVVTARFAEPERDAPVLVAREGGSSSEHPFRRVGDRVFRAGYVPRASGGGSLTLRVRHDRMDDAPREIHVFRRGSAKTARVGEVRVSAGPGTAYGTLFLWDGGTRAVSDDPVAPLTPAWTLEPEGAPVDVPLELAFPAPEAVERPERVHVYRRTRGGWACQRGTWRGDDRLVLTTRSLGTFALMEDDVPPRIHSVTVPEEPTTSRRPEIRARVSDIGSGIDEITVTRDGSWLLMQYDPERELVFWARDQDMPVGEHTIHFRVTDAAGNVTTAEHPLTIIE